MKDSVNMGGNTAGGYAELYLRKLLDLAQIPNGNLAPDLYADTNPPLFIEVKTGKKTRFIIEQDQLPCGILSSNSLEKICSEKITEIPSLHGLKSPRIQNKFFSEDGTIRPVYYSFISRKDRIHEEKLKMPHGSLFIDWGDINFLPFELVFNLFGVNQFLGKRHEKSLEQVFEDLRHGVAKSVLDGHTNVLHTAGSETLQYIRLEDFQLTALQSGKKAEILRKVYPSLDSLIQFRIPVFFGQDMNIICTPEDYSLFNQDIRKKAERNSPNLKKIKDLRAVNRPIIKLRVKESRGGLFNESTEYKDTSTKKEKELLQALEQWEMPKDYCEVIRSHAESRKPRVIREAPDYQSFARKYGENLSELISSNAPLLTETLLRSRFLLPTDTARERIGELLESVRKHARFGIKLYQQWQDKQTERWFQTPIEPLKELQKTFVAPAISSLQAHKVCHGYEPGWSAKKSLETHLPFGTAFSFDLRDAAHSIDINDVFKLCYSAFYNDSGSEEEARFVGGTLALLSTCKVKGNHVLPVGAPHTNKTLNRALYNLDSFLYNQARSRGLHFTRYSDDFIFTSKEFEPLENLAGAVLAVSEKYPIAQDKIFLQYNDGRIVYLLGHTITKESVGKNNEQQRKAEKISPISLDDLRKHRYLAWK